MRSHCIATGLPLLLEDERVSDADMRGRLFGKMLDEGPIALHVQQLLTLEEVRRCVGKTAQVFALLQQRLRTHLRSVLGIDQSGVQQLGSLPYILFDGDVRTSLVRLLEYGLSREAFLAQQPRQLPTGVLPINDVISACLNDVTRTQQLCLAVERHIAELLAQEEGQGQLEVVELGCGAHPVVTLIAGLMHDTRVRVTAVEFNPAAAAMAQATVTKFGLEDRIQIVHADARTYEHPRPIDLAVSETMHSAFTGGEPLLDIARQIAPQLRPQGRFVPEHVTVDWALCQRYAIGGLLGGLGWPEELWSERLHHLQFQPGVRVDLRRPVERIHVRVPLAHLPPEAYELWLSSQIDLHAASGLSLGYLDARVTSPQRLSHPITVLEERPLSEAHISYAPGAELDQIQVRLYPMGSPRAQREEV
jgi:precorrin-6B methylase 2